MKQNDSSGKYKEAFQQHGLTPEKVSAALSGSTQSTRLTKEFSQSRVNLNAKLEISTSLTSHNTENKQIKPNSELAMLTLAINYCLNTQSKMASSIEEIALYLKDNSQENSLEMFASKKQMLLSSSPTNYGSSNISKDKPAQKLSMQAILSKLENLKKEIAAKVLDFENKLSSFDLSNPFQSKNVDTRLTEINYNLTPQVSSNPQYSYFTNKEMEGVSRSKNDQIQMIHVPDNLKNLPTDLTKYCIDSLNETSIVNKVFLEAPNTKHNPFTQSNLLTPQNKTRDDKNTEKKEIGVNKPKITTSNIQSKPEIIKGLGTPKDDKPTTSTSVENTTNDSIKKQSKSTIANDVSSNTKSIYDNIFNQINHKNLQKQVRTQSSPQKDQKLIFADSVSNENLKPLGKTNVPVRRRITSIGAVPTNLIFQNFRFTPRDTNLEAGQRKNSIKPALNIIPQKQIVDDSLRENPIDQTIQLDRSVLNVSDNTQNMTLHDRSHNPDTDRVYSVTEMDEFFYHQTQSFMKNTANKEKAIIKSLMKEQYGEDTISYHKANHGRIHQRKCLINAKWWRAWKDFVNFDADDDIATKSSFFEADLYPRPGPINNRELIRQEAVADLANLTSELELKENLLEHHDYEAVNKKVYDVLAKWYGSDFEICRVLRPDPFRDNKPYLDLYPKKKAVGRSNQKSVDARIDVNYANMIKSIINSNLNAISPS